MNLFVISTPGTSCRGALNHLMPLILYGLPARGHLAFASRLTSRTARERSGSVIGFPQKTAASRSPMELERGTTVERVRRICGKRAAPRRARGDRTFLLYA